MTSAVATGPLNRLFTREESKVKRLRLKVKKSQYGLRGGLGLPMGLLSLMLFLSLASQAWSQDNAESRLAENNGAAHSSADASSVKESSDEASSAVANSAGEGAAGVRSQAIYVPLDPAFVVNYGGPGRLQFLKAELTVRVGSDRDAAAIRHHMPYIRNQLILLFSQQERDSLDSQQGKELLRQAAFEEIHQLMLAEAGELDLMGVYFNQLIVQR